jgi:hypothetical protein
MSRSPQTLFSKTRFSEWQRKQRIEMEQEISELTSTELESSNDSLVLVFSSKYSPNPIQLHEPVQEDVGQVEKVLEKVRPGPNLPRGGELTKKVQRLKLKIPYDGEKHLLHRRPSSMNLPGIPTYDELTDDEIVHYVDYQVKGEDAESIKDTIDRAISKWRKKLEREIRHLNSDIRKMRESMEEHARRKIEDHRGNMEAKEEALEELGISTQRVDEGFVEPEKKKELELPELDGQPAEQQRIRDQTFVDILDIIESIRINLERSKDRLRDLDEESL